MSMPLCNMNIKPHQQHVRISIGAIFTHECRYRMTFCTMMPSMKQQQSCPPTTALRSPIFLDLFFNSALYTLLQTCWK